MKSFFERLLKHCVDVYSGKSGRNGMPYILHPLEVMSKVVSLPEKIVALAHDYGEFRAVSELEAIGVSATLIDKIKLLAKTFPDDIPEDDPRYYDYIWNLLADPVCRKVKYADLMVHHGYEDSPAGDGRRFTGQYPRAMALLADAVEGKIYFNSRTPYFNIFSNFYEETLQINGDFWKSGEHFYQASKFAKNGLQEDTNIFRLIVESETPGTAKRLADEYFSEENKVRSHQALRTFVAMATMLNVKFAFGTLARKRLKQTGDLELVHLSGSDFFWGQNRKGEGKNILGKALMQMRDSGSDCYVVEMMSKINN